MRRVRHVRHLRAVGDWNPRGERDPIRTSMTKTLLVLLSVAACGPVVSSRNGVRVKSIVVREHIELWKNDPPPIHIGGSRLRRAVALLDQYRLVAARPGDQTFEWTEVVDGSATTVEIETEAGEQRIVLSNCPQTRVCSFLRDAFDEELIDRIPETCRPILAGHGVEKCPPWSAPSDGGAD